GGKPYGIVVVAEGAEFPEHGPVNRDDSTDHYGNPRLGGIAHVIARHIERLTGFETRAVTLGHLQRGGPPSAYDRGLATRLGLPRRFGTLVALEGSGIVEKPLDERVAVTRTLDLRLYDEAAAFFN